MYRDIIRVAMSRLQKVLTDAYQEGAAAGVVSGLP
jgi:hypothetical protein